MGEGDKYVDWRVGLIFACSSRLLEEGTPVSKQIGVDHFYELLFYNFCFVAFY